MSQHRRRIRRRTAASALVAAALVVAASACSAAGGGTEGVATGPGTGSTTDVAFLHQAAAATGEATTLGFSLETSITGLSGVGFAVLRLWTGSLFPPAALHWAANGTGVVVGWFVHRRLRRRAEYAPVGEPEDPGH